MAVVCEASALGNFRDAGICMLKHVLSTFKTTSQNVLVECLSGGVAEAARKMVGAVLCQCSDFGERKCLIQMAVNVVNDVTQNWRGKTAVAVRNLDWYLRVATKNVHRERCQQRVKV